tara:strand:- start:16635 stop:17405 length:771 start_codon:yes stop_codon:yes gene_type:complete
MFSEMSLEQIAETAVMYEMLEPEPGYLAELREKLLETRPTPFRIDFGPTKAWVRRQRIMSLAKEDKHAVEARNLLGDYKARPVLEGLLLSGMGAEEVASNLKEITGKDVSKRTIKMFKHYFWNLELLSTSQWLSYLKKHPEGRVLKSCYSRGPEFALWKLGSSPELEQKAVIRGLFNESSMRFFETAGMPNSRETALTAKLWAENIFKATEELNRTGDAVQQVVDGLRDIAIKLGKRDVSSIQDLPSIDDFGDDDV